MYFIYLLATCVRGHANHACPSLLLLLVLNRLFLMECSMLHLACRIMSFSHLGCSSCIHNYNSSRWSSYRLLAKAGECCDKAGMASCLRSDGEAPHDVLGAHKSLTWSKTITASPEGKSNSTRLSLALGGCPGHVFPWPRQRR